MDYSYLPEVSVVVRNFTRAPAKKTSFEFSAPIESPDGEVIPELLSLQEGFAVYGAAGEDRPLLGPPAGPRAAVEGEGAVGRIPESLAPLDGQRGSAASGGE